jgi:hypothetical protein
MTPEKPKVFISYSRRDSSDFAEELIAGLDLAGFAPFLDRHDIAAGEDWEKRLGGLIQEADTVVFVVSPEAIKSERCNWEVDKTVELSKRLLPVIFKPVPDANIPEKLRHLQFVRFDTGQSVTRPFSQLAEALRQDREPSTGSTGTAQGRRIVAKVFINYRRDDAGHAAGRIHDWLKREFGADVLFMDVDAIPLGANFVKVLRSEVAKCDVLLALIGPNWLDVRDEEGNRRLDNPADSLRIEIATALQRDIPVIPILLDGAKIPKAGQLPKDLEELSLRNGLDIRLASFQADMDKLIRGLQALGQNWAGGR